MQIVPIQPTPNQSIQVQLALQSCTIVVNQKTTGVFCDLYVDDVLIAGGMEAQNLNRMVRVPDNRFLGDLMFGDTEGAEDPVYTGFGTRFLLIYLEEVDIARREAELLELGQ